jgi:hypothetical protein
MFVVLAEFEKTRNPDQGTRQYDHAGCDRLPGKIAQKPFFQ